MIESGSDNERCADGHSARELSSCLLELSRLVRGIAFYPAADPHRDELLDRTHTAWQGALVRCGSLHLRAGDQQIETDGLAEPLSGAHVAHLAEAICGQGIAGIALEPGLQRDAVEGLALLLARDPSDLDATISFEPWKGQGVSVESMTPPAPLIEAQPLPDEPAPGTALEFAADELEPDEAVPSAPSKCIDDDPIGAAGDPRGEELRKRLRELDTAESGAPHADACAAALETADELARAGFPDEAYRAVLVLTAHASGASGRDENARAEAQAALRELCDGDMLEYTIQRACGNATARAEVRAAQVLLQIGEPSVPAVLERLRAAREPDQLAQLSAVVIALGERAVEPLARELRNSSRPTARVAVQLAGELQSPRLIAALVNVLYGDDSTLRHDAARSLVTIGRAASQTFCDALTSDDDELVRIATHCLGMLGQSRAVRPLVRAFERSTRARKDGLTRDLIRTLADLGDPRAIASLAEFATRRDWMRRSRQQDLKLAAVAAIERIGGDAAARKLRELRRAPDARIAARAEQALTRCSPADATSQA